MTKIFKNGPSEICGRQPLKNLNDMICLRILCPICLETGAWSSIIPPIFSDLWGHFHHCSDYLTISDPDVEVLIYSEVIFSTLSLSLYHMWCFAMFHCHYIICDACNFTKSNTPPWVFFTFFKLYQRYQIA